MEWNWIISIYFFFGAMDAAAKNNWIYVEDCLLGIFVFQILWHSFDFLFKKLLSQCARMFRLIVAGGQTRRLHKTIN